MDSTALQSTVPAAATPRPRRAEVMGGLQRLLGRVTLAGGEREAIDVIAPFTGTRIGWVPRGTPEDVQEAVRRARAAQPAWARLSFRERGRIFLRFHDLLLARQEEILDLIQLEAGKARRHAYEELADTAIVARHYAAHAAHYLRPRRREGVFPLVTRAWEHHHPVGVVGFISPWNYPLNLGITDAIAGLMAGNAAVLKPDHQTSFILLWAVDLLHEAGLPEDVVQVVTGYGPELGASLIENVDFVMFTGSTRTGRLIGAQAAERLIGCSLELGGKNPMIVLEDADLDQAVEQGVRGSFVGAGQVCVSIERIYVQRPIFDRFVERFAERARGLKLGAGFDYGTEMGSLASERQLETVTEHVRDAVEKGARVLTGGHPRPELGPFFYEPTVLVDVREGMKAFAEETFGPVVAIYPFDTVEEAVAKANDTPYGLSASLWTRDVARGREIATRIQAGSVNLNDPYGAAWGSVASPIGGFKASGEGRRHGAQGILKYTEPQTVAAQRWIPLAPQPILAPQRFFGAVTGVLKLLRRTPGLR